MHKDMHFYGTYAIARAAGIPENDAYTIAYSAQFVDDASEKNSDAGVDGSVMFGIASTHHPLQSVAGATFRRWYEALDNDRAAVMQRQIWVPFHFLPGGEGKSLEEKMICLPDSRISREMMKHAIKLARIRYKTFGLFSLGVAAHVYMDTFAHYGFVGEGSTMNEIVFDSFEFGKCQNPDSNNFIENEYTNFQAKGEDEFKEKCFNFFASKVADAVSGSLGHGSVSSYPDRPYLKWSFEFKHPRPGNGNRSIRNNQQSYLKACKRLYEYFTDFRKTNYSENHHGGRSFNSIEEAVKEVLAFEHGKEERGQKWVEAISDGKICNQSTNDSRINYNSNDWENQRNGLKKMSTEEIVETDIYKFHQAAALHRWFVLKDLLPRHGICVL